MIEIFETKTEYLVKIAPVERERAKKIQGRRWDGTRVCWVYPKTNKIYEQLMAEFGDEASIKKIHPPIEIVKQVPSDLVAPTTDNELTATLADIKEQIQNLAASPKSQDTALLDQQSQQITTLTSELEQALTAFKSKEEQYQQLLEKYRNTNDQLSLLRSEMNTWNSDADGFATAAKEKAKEATSNDLVFCRMVDTLPFDKTLVLDLASHLERNLRKALSNNDRNYTLSNLIIQAGKDEILPPEAEDLAHLIRRQRNSFAHGQPYSKTNDARILMCLFASALLWPDLPE